MKKEVKGGGIALDAYRRRKKKKLHKIKFFQFFFTRSSRLFTSQSLFAEKRRMKTKRHHHHHIQLDSTLSTLSRLLRLTAAGPFVATNDVIISQKKKTLPLLCCTFTKKEEEEKNSLLSSRFSQTYKNKKREKISCHQDDTVQYKRPHGSRGILTQYRTKVQDHEQHTEKKYYRTCSSSSSALLIAFLHFLDYSLYNIVR